MKTNIKTIATITSNANSTIARLDKHTTEKLKWGTEFVRFLNQSWHKLKKKRGELDEILNKAIIALDIADNGAFVLYVNYFTDYLDENEINVEKFRILRKRVLDKFRIEFAKDVGQFGGVILEDSQNYLKFMRSMVRFLDSASTDMKDFTEEK